MNFQAEESRVQALKLWTPLEHQTAKALKTEPTRLIADWYQDHSNFNFFNSTLGHVYISTLKKFISLFPSLNFGADSLLKSHMPGTSRLCGKSSPKTLSQKKVLQVKLCKRRRRCRWSANHGFSKKSPVNILDIVYHDTVCWEGSRFARLKCIN